jgi:hypothetical protein
MGYLYLEVLILQADRSGSSISTVFVATQSVLLVYEYDGEGQL